MIWSNLIGNYKQFIRERVRCSEPHRIYIESAQILSGKVDEICRLIPAFEKEIIWDTRGTRARTSQTKDSVIYTFKNGSTLENVAATEKTRGRRFQAGLRLAQVKSL